MNLIHVIPFTLRNYIIVLKLSGYIHKCGHKTGINFLHNNYIL